LAGRRVRVAAYGVCAREEQVLLARFVPPGGRERHWTLPGGKVEHAEDPIDAVVREFTEETGYRVQVERLLGVDARTVRLPARGLLRRRTELHHVGVFYHVTAAGGALRSEVNGSTDLAAWVDLAAVPGLRRAAVVDVGMRLERLRPAGGHVDPVAVEGLIRQ
jgi:8-oxo-dGTP diphosphatase